MKQVLFDRRLERMIGDFINAFRDDSHAIGKDFQAFLAGDEWQGNAFLVKLIRPYQCETYTLERRALLDDAKAALDNGDVVVAVIPAEFGDVAIENCPIGFVSITLDAFKKTCDKGSKIRFKPLSPQAGLRDWQTANVP
jgi:hypothetical protein